MCTEGELVCASRVSFVAEVLTRKMEKVKCSVGVV